MSARAANVWCKALVSCFFRGDVGLEAGVCGMLLPASPDRRICLTFVVEEGAIYIVNSECHFVIFYTAAVSAHLSVLISNQSARQPPIFLFILFF